MSFSLVRKPNVTILIRTAAKTSCLKLSTFSKESVRLSPTLFDRLLTFRLRIRFWDSKTARPRAPPHLHPALPSTPCPPRLMLDLNHNPSVLSHLFPRA